MPETTTNLIIGSDGVIGRALGAHLVAAGERVVSFDLRRSRAEDARTARLALSDVDRVFLLAWDSGGARYLYRPDTQEHQYAWNLAILRNVLPQLERANVPFVFVSSQLAAWPGTAYGRSKRLGERWTARAGGLSVRLWNVYGALEPASERSHVLSDFIRQGLTRGCIRMLTTGLERRRFVHLRDVCDALRLAGELATSEARGAEAYDAPGADWISIGALAHRIGALLAVPVEAGQLPGAVCETPVRHPLPGWEPSISLECGLTEMIEGARVLSQGAHINE